MHDPCHCGEVCIEGLCTVYNLRWVCLAGDLFCSWSGLLSKKVFLDGVTGDHL